MSVALRDAGATSSVALRGASPVQLATIARDVAPAGVMVAPSSAVDVVVAPVRMTTSSGVILTGASLARAGR